MASDAQRSAATRKLSEATSKLSRLLETENELEAMLEEARQNGRGPRRQPHARRLRTRLQEFESTLEAEEPATREANRRRQRPGRSPPSATDASAGVDAPTMPWTTPRSRSSPATSSTAWSGLRSREVPVDPGHVPHPNARPEGPASSGPRTRPGPRFGSPGRTRRDGVPQSPRAHAGAASGTFKVCSVIAKDVDSALRASRRKTQHAEKCRRPLSPRRGPSRRARAT